jgi:TIR domain
MAKHDIFICFSSKDEASARRVVECLEARQLKCWISLRDVRAGENYQEAIVQALETTRGIVFLFSAFSSQSNEIKKELSLGGGLKVPVFPLRLSPIIPTGALRYELATRQWIDIFPNEEEALDKLADTINEALNRPVTADDVEVEMDQANGRPPGNAVPAATIQSPPRKRTKKANQPVLEANSPELEAVRMLLARHVGPIAKMLVLKASTEASSLDNFCERLADHLSTPADRASFLQAARARLLSVKS